MTWKRVGRTPFGWLALPLGVLVVTLGTVVGDAGVAAVVVPPLQTLAARPRVAADATAPDGPGVFAGVLRGPGDRTSPLGQHTVAWAGWVTITTGSGKSTHTWTVCRTGEVDGLTLERASGELVVNVLDAQRLQIAGRDGFSPSVGVPSLALGSIAHENGPPPPRAFDGCGRPVDAGRLDYYEVRAPLDARVEVSGCLRDGAIERCADALDFVATGGSRAVAQAWADHALEPLRFAIGFAAACCTLAGFLAAQRFVRMAARRAP